MANEKRLIDLDRLIRSLKAMASEYDAVSLHGIINSLKEWPTLDAVEVVRCQNCVHAEPLDHNCELSTSFYMHCKLWRGEETKNVWHRYKKYYKDYSLVERAGYCDSGAKMDGWNEDG